MLSKNSEIEFSEWLDNCIRDAQEKLGLDWMEVVVQLLGKAQKTVLLAGINLLNKPQP